MVKTLADTMMIVTTGLATCNAGHICLKDGDVAIGLHCSVRLCASAKFIAPWRPGVKHSRTKDGKNALVLRSSDVHVQGIGSNIGNRSVTERNQFLDTGQSNKIIHIGEPGKGSLDTKIKRAF